MNHPSSPSLPSATALSTIIHPHPIPSANLTSVILLKPFLQLILPWFNLSYLLCVVAIL